MKLMIRPSEASDAEVLSAISHASMTSAWKTDDFLSAIESDLAVVLTALADDEIAGYVVMYHAADEGEIPSVAVSLSHRRLGIGHALMTELFSQAADKKLTRIFLEVRKSNAPAIALYESFGFMCAGSRPNFYDNPREDALIYTTVIN